MGAHERVALALARHFEVNPALIMKASAFHIALDAALMVMSEEAVIDGVLAKGSLRGALNPYGVLFARIRTLVSDIEDRLRLEGDEAEASRWRRVDAAANRGETLGALVAAGRLFVDEAVEMLAREFTDPDLQAIAMAALDGRRR
jgi:hypothetical protein